MIINNLEAVQKLVKALHFGGKDWAQEVFKVVYKNCALDYADYCQECVVLMSELMDFSARAKENGKDDTAKILRDAAKLLSHSMNTYYSHYAWSIMEIEYKEKLNQKEKDILKMSTEITRLETELNNIKENLLKD